VRRESHAPFYERLAVQSRRPTHQLVGNFKNGGTDYRPKGDPLRVNVHDFEDKTLGKVAPSSTT
jgi:hypothetical protein